MLLYRHQSPLITSDCACGQRLIYVPTTACGRNSSIYLKCSISGWLQNHKKEVRGSLYFGYRVRKGNIEMKLSWLVYREWPRTAHSCMTREWIPASSPKHSISFSSQRAIRCPHSSV